MAYISKILCIFCNYAFHASNDHGMSVVLACHEFRTDFERIYLPQRVALSSIIICVCKFQFYVKLGPFKRFPELLLSRMQHRFLPQFV